MSAHEKPVGILVRLFDFVFEGVGYCIPSYWVYRLLRRRESGELGFIQTFDLYILSWLALEVFLFMNLPTDAVLTATGVIAIALLIVRGLDLSHISWSILLYGRFRKDDDYTVSSLRRSLLINVLNYIELIIIFSLMFWTIVPAELGEPVKSTWNALYFSIITITTVGYGDFHPVSLRAQIIAAVEVLAGVFFAILILGRVLQLLPPPKWFQKRDDT